MGGAVKEKGGKLWENGERGGGGDTRRHTEMGDTKGPEISAPPLPDASRYTSHHAKGLFFFFSSYILFFMEDSSSGVIALVRTTSPQILQKNKTVETDLLCPQNKPK